MTRAIHCQLMIQDKEAITYVFGIACAFVSSKYEINLLVQSYMPPAYYNPDVVAQVYGEMGRHEDPRYIVVKIVLSSQMSALDLVHHTHEEVTRRSQISVSTCSLQRQ